MRFDLLFDDLAAQLAAEQAASAAHEEAEAERLRAARSCLRERIAGLIATDAAARIRLVDGSTVDLSAGELGHDWLAVELSAGAGAIVPLASIVSVAIGAGQARAIRGRMPEARRPDALADRLGIGVVLRDFARRRVPIDVVLSGGGAPLHGTIDRVGRDHFDLAVHERDVPRRERNVFTQQIVALASVALLRV